MHVSVMSVLNNFVIHLCVFFVEMIAYFQMKISSRMLPLPQQQSLVHLRKRVKMLKISFKSFLKLVLTNIAEILLQMLIGRRSPWLSLKDD